MELTIDTLILGAGYSGLILQHALDANSVIVDKGYNHGYTGDDYIIFTKNEFDFSKNPIDVKIEKLSSGNKPFDAEYTEKVYNQKLNVSLFCDDDKFEEMVGFPINSEFLLKYSKIYGNIDVTHIDIERQKVYGRILHLNKKVEIKYRVLYNTIPAHMFCKLCRIDPFKKFNLFISYFPIGIKRATTMHHIRDMRLQYISDPNIPFYRKQMYGNTIYYEYCLNKEMKERFDTVTIPGKFKKPNDLAIHEYHDFFETKNIWHVGRFARWDPDYLLDAIVIDRI